jgi:hypothetical protein
MNDNNVVVLRKAEKLDFLSECKSEGGRSNSISTADKAIKILKDNGILISTNYKGDRMGQYMVNPIYFWKSNNQKKRTERIIEVSEFLKFKENEEN